jgi:hypothetical protein
MRDELGKTDVVRLSGEVEDAESALPHNLSDYWLERIVRDLEVVLESDGDEKRFRMSKRPAVSDSADMGT